jgi:membrane protease YdiL (CAAX protease family)
MSFVPAESLPAAPRRKGRPVLAWLVVLGLIGFLLWRNFRATQDRRSFDPALVEMQARYVVGVATLFGNSAAVSAQAGALNRGPFGERLRFAVVAGELAGPGEARKCLRALETAAADGEVAPPAPEQQRLAEILDRLYADREKGGKAVPLSPTEQEELRKRLGWFGDLALTPAEGSDSAERARVLAPAKRTVHITIGYFGLMALLGFAGLVLGVVLGVLWLVGQVRGRFRVGSPHGGVYAETFAVYLVLFFGLSFAVRYLPVRGDLHPLASGGVALAALAALAWPVLRGVPWRQVRADVGWTLGRRPAVELGVGVGCYLAALPLAMLGVLVFYILSGVLKYFGAPVEQPDHPIIYEVVHGGWGARCLWLIDACVVAPFVEETMFRGVFYRHLREATAGAPPAASVLSSVLVAGFVFAIIHPQGPLFVPVLMGLAAAFALAREWRGTLLPAMIAHGLNNGATMALLLLTAG